MCSGPAFVRRQCQLVLSDTVLCCVVGLQFGLQTLVTSPCPRTLSEDFRTDIGVSMVQVATVVSGKASQCLADPVTFSLLIFGFTRMKCTGSAAAA